MHKTGYPTVLDLRLGHLTEEQQAEISRRLVPMAARIVRRLLAEEQSQRPAAAKQS